MANDLTPHDPLLLYPTSEELAGVDPQRVFELFRARFADAAAFTFVIVGDVDPDALRPMVERYLGGLPSTATHTGPSGSGARWRTGDRTIVRDDGTGARAEIRFLGWNGTSVDYRALPALQILVHVIELRLRALLRDELAEVYAIDVDDTALAAPEHGSNLTIGFSCAPKNARALAAAMHTLFGQLRDGGITDDDIARARAQVVREYEDAMRTPQYWRDQLVLASLLGGRSDDVVGDASQVARDLSSDQIRALARTYLAFGASETGILLPAAAQ